MTGLAKPPSSAAITTFYVLGQPLPVWDSCVVEGQDGLAVAGVGEPPDAAADARPVLVFLHGWGLAPPAYRALLTALASRYRVVAPFIPGLCSNRPVWTYTSHGELAAVIAAVLDQMQLGVFHLVGQSTGGGIAVALAADQPERVVSLTLIDASGLPRLAARRPVFARMRELVAETAAFGITAPGFAMARSFGDSIISGRAALVRAAQIPLREDLSERFTAITAPTLILWGECDRLFPVVAGHAMAALIPGARLEIVRGGWHSWEINRHAEAATFITRHVDGIA